MMLLSELFDVHTRAAEPRTLVVRDGADAPDVLSPVAGGASPDAPAAGPPEYTSQALPAHYCW